MNEKTAYLLIGIIAIVAITGWLSYPAGPEPFAGKKTVDPTESIRRFIGEPDAVVAFEERRVNAAGEPYDSYRVNNDRFTVDPETGMVTGALFMPVPMRNKVTLSLEQAKSSARKFAQLHYGNFNSRNMQLTESQLLDHGDEGSEYSYTWNEQDQSINTGNLVHVSLNTDGTVRSYYARDRTAPKVEPARITKDQAVETATRYTIETTKIGNISSRETSAQLTVMPGNSNRVVWAVSVVLRYTDLRFGFEDHRGGEVYVDAMTGDVVEYNPCQ